MTTAGVLREPGFENRVSLIPESAGTLGLTIRIESSAGSGAFFSDEEYMANGAEISNRSTILSSDMIFSINPPSLEDLDSMKAGAVLVSMINPLVNTDYVAALLNRNITCLSLESVPRTTRAQSMDILSSMATVAGYKAVLLAAGRLPKFFPLLMTAAGSIPPAKVLIIGAGVAGLQAIATAKRLGGVVEVFDVRSAVKEEVQSLGGKFIEVAGAKEDKAAGGYAVEQSADFLEKQKQLIHDHAIKSDVIICTAQIPGRKAPLLITRESVNGMKKGSIIVDLAASSGGNCELTENNKTIEVNGVAIIGDSNLPSSMPADASRMFSKNLINLLKIMIKDGNLNITQDDDILKETVITNSGEIWNSRVKSLLNPVESK
jgi:NAD(P) transhydrogenase subunit alpha